VASSGRQPTDVFKRGNVSFVGRTRRLTPAAHRNIAWLCRIGSHDRSATGRATNPVYCEGRLFETRFSFAPHPPDFHTVDQANWIRVSRFRPRVSVRVSPGVWGTLILLNATAAIDQHLPPQPWSLNPPMKARRIDRLADALNRLQAGEKVLIEACDLPETDMIDRRPRGGGDRSVLESDPQSLQILPWTSARPLWMVNIPHPLCCSSPSDGDAIVPIMANRPVWRNRPGEGVNAGPMKCAQ